MMCDMGTLDGMSAVIAGGPAAGALMPPLGCVLCHAWNPDCSTSDFKYVSKGRAGPLESVTVKSRLWRLSFLLIR